MNNKTLEMSGILIVLLGLVFFREIQQGIFLGIVSTICMGMTFYAMPTFIQKTICKFRVTVDILLAFAVPLWFGNFTATAVTGSAVNSIFMSILLNEEYKKFNQRKFAYD